MKCMADNKLATEKLKEEVINITVRLVFVSMASVLTDEYGCGKKRTAIFIERIQKKLQSMEKGYVTLKELEDALYEDHGIRIR